MFKAIILLKRKEGMAIAAFRDWWLQGHAPLARRLPGLRKGVFNLVEGDGTAAFDGVSELWFDSREAFEAAYLSETGQAVAADSLSRVARRERLLVFEVPLTPEG